MCIIITDNSCSEFSEKDNLQSWFGGVWDNDDQTKTWECKVLPKESLGRHQLDFCLVSNGNVETEAPITVDIHVNETDVTLFQRNVSSVEGSYHHENEITWANDSGKTFDVWRKKG